jgi:hypothetical protein
MELYSVLADCELFGDGAVAYARCHGPQHIASAPTEGTECSRRSNAAGGARGRRVARSLLHQGVADRIVLSSVDVSVDGVPVPASRRNSPPRYVRNPTRPSLRKQRMLPWKARRGAARLSAHVLVARINDDLEQQ